MLQCVMELLTTLMPRTISLPIPTWAVPVLYSFVTLEGLSHGLYIEEDA